MALAKMTRNHGPSGRCGGQPRIRAALIGAAFLMGCSLGSPSPGAGGSGGCVETELCATSAHWDPSVCGCVPNALDAGSGGEGASGGSAGAAGSTSAGSTSAAGAAGTPSGQFCSGDVDCQGPLPQICQICPNGATACAHYECVAAQCEVTICPTSSLAARP
jgi:hypothetical protein